MAYFDVFSLTVDNDFFNRVSASYVIESGAPNPNPWIADHIWQVSASPGFGDKYASALANGIARPGKDQSVISDLEILSAVQAVLAT